MSAQEKQIRQHVGDEAAERAGAFSFVYGRGWRVHKSVEIAERTVRREVRAFVRTYGGGDPQHMVRGPLALS